MDPTQQANQDTPAPSPTPVTPETPTVDESNASPVPEAPWSPSPAPQVEPQPETQTEPTPAPQPAVQQQQYTQPATPMAAVPVVAPSLGLAITSMVLGILSVLIALIWFVSAPLAITAIILGIISLVKKHGGKGMSIAGIITASVALVIAVLMIAFTFVTYNGAYERALESQRKTESQMQTQEELFN